jgi:arginine repressor
MLEYIAIKSVTITKREQIEQRRARVLELSSQGLTQYDIVGRFKEIGISVSQKTISNDLAWLRKDAVLFVKENREHVAFEYKQALSNFYQLRKEAWNQFFNKETSETAKTHLYSIIQNINNNITNLLGVGDLIAEEAITESQETVEQTRKALDELSEMEEEEVVAAKQEEERPQSANGS